MHFRQTTITAVRLRPLAAPADAPDPEVAPLFLAGLRMHIVDDHVPEHLGGGRNFRLYAPDPAEGIKGASARRVLERLDLTPWWAHPHGVELVAWSPESGIHLGSWTRLTLGPLRLARPGKPYPELPDDPHRVGRTLVLSLLGGGLGYEEAYRNLRVDPTGPYEECGPHVRDCGGHGEAGA